MKLLSTKILNPEQQDRLTNAGYSVSQYDALTINLNTFSIPNKALDCIFTSQNAAQAFINNTQENTICNGYCVGEKAALLLSQNGHNIVEIGENSAVLAKKIVKNHQNKTFYYFSGNLRRPELPLELTKAQILFTEIQAYTTHINYKAFNSDFNVVLYFSPSGVQSFHHDNKASNYTAICIGSTTAKEAINHTKKHQVALHTTVDGVIDAALKAKKLLC